MTQSEKRLFLIQSLLKERPEYRQVETPRDPEGQRQLLRGLMNVRPPQAADPDFLRVQDAYLQAETAARGITDLADLTPVQPGLYVWQGDISTGIFRFPNQPAAQIAVKTVRDFLAGSTSVRKVIFNVFKDRDNEIYHRLLSR